MLILWVLVDRDSAKNFSGGGGVDASGMMRSVFRMAPQRLTHRTRSRARGLVRALATALLCSAPFTFGVAQAGSGEAGDLLMVIESSTFQLSVLDSRSGERSPTIRVALGSPEQATPTGRFPLERIILSPSWRPGVVATRAGAEPEAASLDTPMGAVKIPFAADGVIALHGGGDRRVLGKPISAGCVRATDADLLRVVAWLDGRDALAAARRAQNGEFHRRFRRPIALVVR